MNAKKQKKRKYKRKRIQNERVNRISGTKLFLILLGCFFIFLGTFIGDFNCIFFNLSSYLSISIGFAIQLLTIAIFVKQNSIKTNDA